MELPVIRNLNRQVVGKVVLTLAYIPTRIIYLRSTCSGCSGLERPRKKEPGVRFFCPALSRRRNTRNTRNN